MQKRYFNDISEMFSATNIMEHHYKNAESDVTPVLYNEVKDLLKFNVPHYYTRTETGCMARCDDVFEDYLITRKLKKVHFEFDCHVNYDLVKRIELGMTFVGTKDGDVHCFTFNPLTKNSLIISFDIEELSDVLDQVLIFHSENFRQTGNHLVPVNTELALPDYILVYGSEFYLYKSKLDGGYKMPEGLGLDHEAYEKYLTKKAKNPSIQPYQVQEKESPVKYLFSEYDRLSKDVRIAGGLEHIKAVEQSFMKKFGRYLVVSS